MAVYCRPHVMPMLPEVNELVRSRQSSQPRTILGFLFGMSTLIMSAAVVISVAFIESDSSAIAVSIIGVAALVVVTIIVAVIRQARSDPAGLMLGQITGSEYEAIRRLTLGDSAEGERVETVTTGFVIDGEATPAALAEVDPREDSA